MFSNLLDILEWGKDVLIHWTPLYFISDKTWSSVSNSTLSLNNTWFYHVQLKCSPVSSGSLQVKNLGPKKILDLKKIWGPKKNFESEKKFGPKNIWVQTKFWVQKKFCLWKKFGVWKTFGFEKEIFVLVVLVILVT